MNRQYESILFFNPTLTQEEINTIISKIKNILIDLQGNIVEEKPPEKVKLPYKMKKHKDGFYYYIKFDLSPVAISNFRDRIKLIEGIIKITISLVIIKKAKIKNKDKKTNISQEIQEIQESLEEMKEEEQIKSEMANFDEEVEK